MSPGPSPSLSFWGDFESEDASRLSAQAGSLDSSLRRLTYVDYEEVRSHCETLAGRLVSLLGRGRIQEAVFTAIPRGGLSVLSQLAYMLDLRPDQIEGSGAGRGLTVVVDDVSLTGHRLGQFLESIPGHPVVFCHLLSAPALRDAIEQTEPCIEACVAAADLADHSSTRLGAGLTEWRERWRSRYAPPRYWMGQTDHAAFPWSEPDLSCWDPSSGEVLPGLKIVPPMLCLANQFRRRQSRVAVCEQVPATGPLRPSSRAVYLRTETGTLVADRNSGEILELDGSGGRFWQAILEFGDEEAAGNSLLGELDVAAETLHADVSGFVEHLLRLGLLVRDAESGPDGR